MLEYMKYSSCGFLGEETLEIQKEGEKYTVRFQKRLSLDWQVFENIDLAEWAGKLEGLQINKWKKVYDESCIISEKYWKLDYKTEGKRCRHIGGNNDYPDNFDDFIDLTDELCERLSVDRRLPFDDD